MTRTRLARTFWIGAAAILVAAALVALVAVLRGEFSETDGRILGTLGAALVAGSAAIAGLALAERGGRVLGWAAVALSVPAFAALLYPIWDLAFDGDHEDAWRWGWLGGLTLIAVLIAVSAQLVARSPSLRPLAWLAGGLAAVAAAVSGAAVWTDDPGETYGRVVATLWILAALSYLLVPILQRFTAAGRPPDEERLLGELDGVLLVATRAGTIDPRLAPGERLALRRRA